MSKGHRGAFGLQLRLVNIHATPYTEVVTVQNPCDLFGLVYSDNRSLLWTINGLEVSLLH